MDLDLLLIFVFMVAIVAVVLGVGDEMLNRWLTHRERYLERLGDGSTPKPKEIEERLRVLERIATDRGHDLADQIENLRRESPALSARRADGMEPKERETA